MSFATRIGDITTDSGCITGPCVPNVFIGGMPAAVVGDIHSCPTLMGPVPFPKGSTSVLIGGKPALRTIDPCPCGGLVAIGCQTVIIGG